MSLCHYTYIYGIKLHNNGWSKEELECDEEEKKYKCNTKREAT